MISINDYILKHHNDLTKIKLFSSLETINQVDSVISYHSNNHQTNDSAIILNIFGLLQSIFVGIDALYNLTLDLTKNKSNININQNITLNKLKFIRNDIVGHPVNRKYGENSVGYSIIKSNNLDYNFFEYDTYLKKNNSITKINQKVDLIIVKEQYVLEKNIIMNHLELFINKKNIKTNLKNLVNELIINTTEDTILKIKNEFYSSYGKMSNNRLIWRLDLISEVLSNKLFNNELSFLKEFILLKEINKVVEITNTLENNKLNEVKINITDDLLKVFKYLNKNNKLDPYLKYIHDNNSTYYINDLNYLIENVNETHLQTILNILKTTNNRNLIYLLGSTLKLYKKY